MVLLYPLPRQLPETRIMDNKPGFTTAVPQKRYQVGEYQATILGDIESSDGREYRYILAMIVDGSHEPKLYVTVERNRDRNEPGKWLMRVMGHKLNETVGASDQWQDINQFTASSLNVAMQLLALTDEIPALLS